MKRSAYLRPGDTVAVIACASPIKDERLQAGVAELMSRGYTVRLALDPSEQYGKKDFMFSSDSISARCKALEDLFRDPEVKVIITARGGYGSLELLPKLDWELIGNNPKILVGFSDVTALLIGLSQKAQVVCLHGPSLESLSKANQGEQELQSCNSLIKYLSTELEQPFLEYELEHVSGSRKRVEGKLLGGNLSVFVSLLGSDYEPECEDRLLFLEEVAESPYRIHRMLMQLKLSGKLERLSGVLIGCLDKCEHAQALGSTVEEVIVDIFKDYTYPVYKSAPFGHLALNLPVPLGINAAIEKGRLVFLEGAVLC